MVTKRDDDRQPTDRQGEYRAICLLKVGRQSFAIMTSMTVLRINHHQSKTLPLEACGYDFDIMLMTMLLTLRDL